MYSCIYSGVCVCVGGGGGGCNLQSYHIMYETDG